MDTENENPLQCDRCGKVEELYCHITYSQGTRVCRCCKEKSKESDARAFDRFQNSRGIY